MIKESVLELLLASEGHISGAEMSQHLRVSRNTIWKAIEQLRREGYRIDAVSNRGYLLLDKDNILTGQTIQRIVSNGQTGSWIKSFTCVREADSTNLMARRAAARGCQETSLFITEHQTHGRGRLGRSWQDEAGQSLTFSLLLQPQARPADMAPVTLWVGLCAAQALNQLGKAIGMAGDWCGIKWPNDLVAASNGKKVAGTLTELMLEDNRVAALIIGVGVNINTRTWPDEIRSTATSLALESGRTVGRLEVLDSILGQMAAYQQDMIHPGAWLPEYRKLCLTLGREVSIQNGQNGSRPGRAIDVDEAGELIIEDQTGQLITVRAGEVSVRGLAGYV